MGMLATVVRWAGQQRAGKARSRVNAAVRVHLHMSFGVRLDV
jgi:hypothetical protein